MGSSGLGGAGQVAASSVSGKSQGASAGPRAPKKKMAKQKRHSGLPSQERQEYYKSCLAHLYYWHFFSASCPL